MSAPSITTSVYKYKRYAPLLIGIYAILAVLVFLYSSAMTTLMVGIAIVVLLLVPIYGAIRPKSFFSARSVDERKLYIDSENIIWDGVTMPVKNVAGLSIYLFSFDNFKHAETWLFVMNSVASEYGDQNKLNFTFDGRQYDFTFYIGNYTQYRAVLQIIEAWQKAGVRVFAKAAFEHSYIKSQNAIYGRG